VIELELAPPCHCGQAAGRRTVGSSTTLPVSQIHGIHSVVFTGLIEDLGTISAVQSVPQGVRLSVQTKFDDLEHGASVAVDGVCLTAVEPAKGRFTADVSAETLKRTTLGERKAGDKVNLERPLAVGDRLGGHFVLGHVDGVGTILRKDAVGEGVRVEIRLPKDLMQYLVEKGSVAIDGISLTLNEFLGADAIMLFLIPETLRATTLGEKGAGARVNVEADVLGKHVARLMESRTWK
jgi:riboflavin synthase